MKTLASSDRSRWITPLFVLAAFAAALGAFTLVNRFQGGFMSQGILRHACWMIIALSFGAAVGCVGQALEWQRKGSTSG